MASRARTMLGRSLRPLFERRFWLNVLLVLCVTPLAAAESLTLPRAERPAWLQRDGIVMAGSWEPLVFRVRRGPQGGTPPSLDSPPGNGYKPSAGQRAAYEKEHGPEMVADLKRLGVNFVMLHGYKGAGLAAEGESMKDAARFARLCRDSGLRVGSYLDSATLLVELLFKERPDAKDWIVRDRDGNPLFYGNASYRYRWNRNHPDAHRYYLDVLRAAIAEIQPDLVHLDNYIYGPDCDATSVGQFRAYLRRTFTPEQLRAGGIDDVDKAQPATSGPPDSLLRRAWIDFACQWLADSYYARTRFARTLRKDVLMECNPGGVGCAIHVPVDHARLVQGGEAFWDEGAPLPKYQGKGPLETRIRSYKVARRNDNMVFCYTTTPLELAEAMAFNLDCLGCVCFFEYGIVRSRPWLEDGVSPDARRYIQFFHDRRGVLGGATVVADVAVLRSFPSMAFGDPADARLTCQAEQSLIEGRACFQIIYPQHLDDPGRYRVLVLAGCMALSDPQIEQIRRYVGAGGRLCVTGPLATHDEWMFPRNAPGLTDLPAERVVRLKHGDDLLAAIGRLCDDRLSLDVTPRTVGLCTELTEQPGRRMVHLVNYRSDGPVREAAVGVRVPDGQRVKSVTLISPDRQQELTAPFTESDGVARFTVPAVKTYEIAVVSFQAE